MRAMVSSWDQQGGGRRREEGGVGLGCWVCWVWGGGGAGRARGTACGGSDWRGRMESSWGEDGGEEAMVGCFGAGFAFGVVEEEEEEEMRRMGVFVGFF